MTTMKTQFHHCAVSIATLVSLIASSVAPIAAHSHERTDASSRRPEANNVPLRGYGTRPSQPSVDDHARLIEAYGKLPLSFEPNYGQTDQQVKFLSRGDGYTLFLTSTEAVLSLRQNEGGAPEGRSKDPTPSLSQKPLAKTGVIRMRLAGANREARIEGQDPLTGKSNYLIGSDRARWHTDISTYAKVRYAGVYPGIDLSYYGNQRQIEYDFTLAPGADPALITVAFEGSSKTLIDDHGDLVLNTAAGEVIQRAPIVYQETESGRKSVEARYVLKRNREVSFDVGSFDRSKPLVIDPQLVYSTFLGGAPNVTPRFALDVGIGIAADKSGNAYITGETDSTDFPVLNQFQGPTPGDLAKDAFVTKLDPTGTQIIYSTYLGGHENDDVGSAIAVTGDGKACITGTTQATIKFHGDEFPTTPSRFQGPTGLLGATKIDDAFVTILTPDGSELVYSTLFGGSLALDLSGNDKGLGIALDNLDRIYITGSTASKDLPTKNAFQRSRQSSGEGTDAFIAKFDPGASGNDSLLYASYLGGSGDDVGKGIAVDSAGNAYIAGDTHSVDLETKSPAGQSLPPFRSTFQGGDTDAFVAKIDPTNATGASSLVYLTYFGGTARDRANAIAVDSSQRAYITGFTQSSATTFPLFNSFDSTQNGGEAFVAKLNANGTTIFYSSFLGGNGSDEGFGIAIDSAANTYVAGRTASSDFPQINALPTNLRGTSFLTKLEASVSTSTSPKILYSTTFGGTSNGASVNALALDPDGNVYLTGVTGSGLPTTPGAFQTTFQGGSADAFVAKFGSTFPDTIGVFRPATNQFLLRNSNTTGNPDITIGFGQAGDIQIAGDWDGDGSDDVGVFRPSTGEFLLRQTTRISVCVPLPCHIVTLVNTITIRFGQAGDLPVAGDWDGDGVDTIGVFRNGTFILKESNATFGPTVFVNFGSAGDLPVAGDWDGDGVDTVGFFRPSAIQFQLTNTSQGTAVPNFSFFFGLATDLPVAGDFNGDGIDTVGILRDGQFFLTNSNSNPVVETAVQFGAAGDDPVIGDWDGKPPQNQPPNNGVNIPNEGSSAPGQLQQFITSCSDPDGWRDIRTIDFRIAASLAGGIGVPAPLWAQFDQDQNLIRFYDGDTEAWSEGAPGSDVVLSNRFAELHLSSTHVQGSGPTGPRVQITWAVVFKEGAVHPNYKQYLKIDDDNGASTGFDRVGTWSVRR